MRNVFEPVGIVSVNGSIFASDQPAIAVSDQGLMYGWGVFETMRVYKKRPFLLDKHLDRMLDSIADIDIVPGASKEKIAGWVDSFISFAGIKEGVLRITLTKGRQDVSNIILTHRLLTYTPEQYKAGFKAMTAPFKRNAYSATARIKSLNYLDNMLAKQQAVRLGFDEALMFNTDNILCECSMSNIFFIDGDRLYTPALECGLLAGITREAVIEGIAPALGKSISEGKYLHEHLAHADEAFITNSVMQIMPLVSLDGISIGNGRPGKLTQTIISEYDELVRKNIRDIK